MTTTDGQPMVSPAEWHPDPLRRHELRYWDGQSWTEHVSDRGITGVDRFVGATTSEIRPNRKGTKAAIIIFGVVVVLVVLGELAGHLGPSDTPTASVGSGHVVTIDVTGTTTAADITLDISGHISQHNGVGVPLKSTTGDYGITEHLNDGDVVSISAQNARDSGDISCVIRDGNQVLDSNRSQGAYAVVTCGASL